MHVCTEASMSGCILRILKASKNVQISHMNPQRVYLSALVAHVIDQVYIATCGIPQQILLPTDLINGPHTETVSLHQTPTDPSFLPQCPVSSSLLLLIVNVWCFMRAGEIFSTWKYQMRCFLKQHLFQSSIHLKVYFMDSYCYLFHQLFVLKKWKGRRLVKCINMRYSM